MEVEKKAKENFLNKERYLSKYATKSSDAIRMKEEDEDIRPPFFHDIDRIIHSLSYTRYMDKTQVFTKNNNDHISKRITHVQLVSKIARTIGRALNLNEDLIEAIALGHDIGHTPLGHAGEAILNEISLRELNQYFSHNIQSVRTLMNIENKGLGRNITVQVLDAIMCHNGEVALGIYEPRKKTVEEFLEEYNNSYKYASVIKNMRPMTLEGCVVRVSDLIGYLGRDIEDAIRVGIIDKNEIPTTITSILGSNNREIVNTIVMDIIKNSYNKNYIKISDNVYNAIKELKDFNYKHIYLKANTKDDLSRYEDMFRSLFNTYVSDVENSNLDSPIYRVYLNYKDEVYKENTSKRIAIDFIAGMTDDYFNLEYKRIINEI